MTGLNPLGPKPAQPGENAQPSTEKCSNQLWRRAQKALERSVARPMSTIAHMCAAPAGTLFHSLGILARDLPRVCV